MAFIELGRTPWGTDYTKAADVKAAWLANKEFHTHEGSGLELPIRHGQTTTREELKELLPADTHVVIRYNRQEKLTTVKL